MAIGDYEYSVIIDSLNNLQSKLIADGKYTDAVDELIIKFIHAPIKKFKIKMTEFKIMKKQYWNRWAAHTNNRKITSLYRLIF